MQQRIISLSSFLVYMHNIQRHIRIAASRRKEYRRGRKEEEEVHDARELRFLVETSPSL